MEWFYMWSIVSGDGGKLDVIACPIATSIQELEKWENKVKVLLRMFINDIIISNIHDCKISNETWTTIKD